MKYYLLHFPGHFPFILFFLYSQSPKFPFRTISPLTEEFPQHLFQESRNSVSTQNVFIQPASLDDVFSGCRILSLHSAHIYHPVTSHRKSADLRTAAPLCVKCGSSLANFQNFFQFSEFCFLYVWSFFSLGLFCFVLLILNL